MSNKTITILKPDDFHIHLRQGDPLVGYAKDVQKWFKRVVAMPNTLPAMSTVMQMREYRDLIESSAPGLEVLSSFKLDAGHSIEDIRAFKEAGALIAKYYPQGATTNSEGGVTQWESCYPVFAAMEEVGVPLSLHGEEPDSYSLDREKDFLPKLDDLAKRFPKLKVILEHVSSAEGVAKIKDMPETFAATVTVHHLKYTLDDVIGGGANVHLFCKPVLKSPADRKAIQQVVFEGHKRFFFGSDSAPHLRAKKETSPGAAGVYTAPVALPLLTQIFEEAGCLDKLENFTSRFGADYYDIPYNKSRITLVKEPWRVPSEYHGVVPVMANEELSWQLG